MILRKKQEQVYRVHSVGCIRYIYHVCIFFPFRWKNDPEHHAEGVVPPPQDPNAPGELGKPVKFDNPEPEVKALIDEGWKNNAFNQYASDVISLHRSLPDPRDSW